MLGEQIGQGKGKITNRRVLDDNGVTRVESSFQSEYELYGVKGVCFGTYVSEMRPDGSLYGSGQGVFMGKGGEHATFRGSGVGLFQDNGTIQFRGSVAWFTQSQKLERINKCAALFEHDVTGEGEIEDKVFEWR